MLVSLFAKDECFLVLTANGPALQPRLPALLTICGIQKSDHERFIVAGCEALPGFEAVALGLAAAPSFSQPAGGGLGRAAPPSCRPSPLRRVDGLESRRRTSSASHARLVGRCSLRSPSYLPTIPCVGTGGPHWDPRAVRPGDPHEMYYAGARE